MSQTVDYYFDFSSPFAYIAAHWVDELEATHDVSVQWKPFLLGAVFKMNGAKPLTQVPLKGAYATHDIQRTTRKMGLSMQLPSKFPFFGIAPTRAFYATSEAKQAKALATALLKAAFERDEDITKAENILMVAESIGIDGTALQTAMGSDAIKQKVREVTDEAIERGVFGSPYFIVGDEPFWGNEKRADLEQWLKTGGW